MMGYQPQEEVAPILVYVNESSLCVSSGCKSQACGTRLVMAKGEGWSLSFPAPHSGRALGPGPSTSSSSIRHPGAHPSGSHFSTELEPSFPPALLDGQWRSQSVPALFPLGNVSFNCTSSMISNNVL